MTVAIAVKVFDGIVLATDSATTLPLPGGGSQVYNTANKVFHLHRRQPIAAMTWGMGNIGSASIATIAKDLRRRFMGNDPTRPNWQLPDDYTVETVAERLVEIVFDELYAKQTVVSTLGFLVAGYSANATGAEAWSVIMDDPNTRPAPLLVAGENQSGWLAYAQAEAVNRLFNGWDANLAATLWALPDPATQTVVTQALDAARRTPVVASMPFADAINLAGFAVEVTMGYSRFLLGPDTVGGPVEIAGISRHEGFKWISRKHYYHRDLNPEDPHHDY